jgi:uncharacterized membrane protein YbhN (UPF0104 family)
MRRTALRPLVPVITVGCVAWVLFTFNWPDILRTLSRMDVIYFIGFSSGALVAALALRALRWLVLTAEPVTFGHLAHAMLVNGFASGLAAVTPMQLGELIKARFLPVGDRVRVAVPVLVVERLLDAGCLVSLGVLSLLWHFDYIWWMAAYVLLAVACLATALMLGRSSRLKNLKALRWLSGSGPGRPAILTALATSVPMWIAYALMWWFTARSIGVDLSAAQTATLISSVMLAIAATLVPSGLGVSELASSGVLVWYGYSALAAESVAMALRMLTPLLACLAIVCGSLLWFDGRAVGSSTRY